MKTRTTLLASLLVTLLLFTWVTWPLAPDFHEGMPSSHRPEPGGARYLIPGDHLQFLFQLWMFADATTGGTPWFYHVYEFNQGDDHARYEPGTYYFPFGALYAVGYFIGGRAVGWNLMLLISAWVAYLMTWFLTRRFCRSAVTAAVAALPGLLLPYFWTCSLGGSPTGPGMLWVPVIFLGIDKAVRDRKVWGGVLAGCAVFMAPWADLHVFFFAFLAAPVWMAFCFGADAGLRGEAPGGGGEAVRLRDRAIPLLPAVALMGLAYLQTALVKHSLSGTVVSGGRKASEAMIYAPTWDGWVAFDPGSRHNLIYLGIVALALLAVGLLLLLRDTRSGVAGRWGRLACFGLLLAAIAGIALLALGPNIPKDPHQRVWHTLRSVLPPYKMIRQPAKIYCILAPFLAVALAMALDRFAALFARRRVATGLTVGIGLLLAWDYGRRIDPTICLLDHEQGAYRAIAEDAARSGRENRVMSIPIWPGDSHWNSLTEYYATLYRTKFLNGYRPSIRKQYLEEIFGRLAPMNMGFITDDRLDMLLARRIGYLTLQEDAFPEKVSPFAVSHTLRELMRHPRLRLLARDGEIWAFKILEAGAARGVPVEQEEAPPILLGGRAWRAKSFVNDVSLVRRDADGDDGYARLGGPADAVELPPRQFYAVPGLRYLVAARGSGRLVAAWKPSDGMGTQTVAVAVAAEWTWVEVPVPGFEGIHDIGVTLTAEGGPVDVDMVTFVAGPWPWLTPGQETVLRADAFFRAGHSDPRDGSVTLAADRAPAGGKPLAATRVSVGQPVGMEFQYDGPRPLRLELRYSRQGDLKIHHVALSRLE